MLDTNMQGQTFTFRPSYSLLLWSDLCKQGQGKLDLNFSRALDDRTQISLKITKICIHR